MIKKTVFEQDLIVGMQRELQSYNKKAAMANLNQAGEYLHSAMEIFEQAGLSVQADQILSILHKIATKSHRAEVPNLEVFFKSNKFTLKDFKDAMMGDIDAIAKINAAMHEHGWSDQKIVNLLGKNYMPYHLAKKILQKSNVSGLQNWKTPSPKPGEEIVINPIDKKEKLPEGEDIISMKSLLASLKTDKHIKGLTSDKMVENLKHHGIVFNMADDGETNDLLELDLNEEPLEVVEEDIDKSFEDED